MNAKSLFQQLKDNGKEFAKKEGLGEITELVYYGKENKIVFAIDWFDTFTITFRPQTIGLKINKVNKITKESKSISKSYPLTENNIFNIIFEQYKNLIK